MNSSTVHKRWITVNSPLTTHFSANFETWTPWKRFIQNIKNYLAADWRLKNTISIEAFQTPGEENYHFLFDIWNQAYMCTFKVFLRRYNNKGFVPTLEEMQKMLAFPHKKGIDMLKLGCTLPNLAIFVSTNKQCQILSIYWNR